MLRVRTFSGATPRFLDACYEALPHPERMLVVQKYGGTSVATAERIKHVADRIIRRVQSGDQVVAVVSAMGDATDDLIALAHEVAPDPSPREYDMLVATGEQVSCALVAMALQAKGYDAISLTGQQAGIFTRAQHTDGRIHRVEAERVQRELDAGRIPVIAGFQGITEEFEIVTLGRGASDLTGIVLAIAPQGRPLRELQGRHRHLHDRPAHRARKPASSKT